MSREIFTIDDALSDLDEQVTQPASSVITQSFSDKTQSEPPLEPKQSEPAQAREQEQVRGDVRSLQKTQIPSPAETALARIIEDSKETEENQGPEPLFSVASSWNPPPVTKKSKIGKKKKKSELMGEKEDGKVLQWDSVAVVKKEKVILRNVAGHARAGHLTFIMGSSGAGKTTLMNYLTGRNKRGLQMSGHIYLNGRQLTNEEMKAQSSYVQQEDLFMANQTVSETLDFAVRMRHVKVLNRKERKVQVKKLLNDFNLTSCKDIKVGAATRGERKRLSFACETLNNPAVLFCDEPTTGLDSFMSHKVMKSLKAISKQGRIVVCTVHQPSTWVYEMADHLVVMCQGRVAFEGSPRKVVDFLKRINRPLPLLHSVSDHLIQVLSRRIHESVESYEQRVEKIVETQTKMTPAPKKPESPKEKKAKPKFRPRPWCFQFGALMRRSLVQMARRKKYLISRLALTILVAWFLGMVYLQVPIHRDHLLAIKGVVFGALHMTNTLYMMPSLTTFWEDFSVVVREYQSNMYSPSAFFAARSICESLLHLIFPTIFVAIIYVMTGLPMDFTAVSTFLTMCLAMSMIITSLAHAVVALCGNVTTSLTMAPLISVPMMVFGGFMITVDSVPWYYKPLSWISWYHYAFEAIIVAIFEKVGKIDGCHTVNPNFDIECSTGLKFIHDQDFRVENFWIDFAAIGAILVFWKVLGLVAFVVRIRISN